MLAILSLRVGGLNRDTIAGQMHLTPVEVDRHLERAPHATRNLRENADAQAAFDLELERLDSLWRTSELVLRQAVAQADHATALKAVDRQIRISHRRSQLRGLDGTEPEKPAAELTPLEKARLRRDAKHGAA